MTARALEGIPAYSDTPHCLVCGEPLAVRQAHGRRSKKAFITLVCPRDGRHFRAFINDQSYVAQVMERLKAKP